MMPYIFCLLVDLAAFACVAWLGWLVWLGASAWMIIVMGGMAAFLIIPGRDIFTCPKCGHVANMKVYKSGLNTTVGVQKEKGTPDD